MTLNKNHIGSKWMVDSSKYIDSKGCHAVITSVKDTHSIGYVYYLRDGKAYANGQEQFCSEYSFLTTYILMSKHYELEAKINKIKENL